MRTRSRTLLHWQNTGQPIPKAWSLRLGLSRFASLIILRRDVASLQTRAAPHRTLVGSPARESQRIPVRARGLHLLFDIRIRVGRYGSPVLRRHELCKVSDVGDGYHEFVWRKPGRKCLGSEDRVAVQCLWWCRRLATLPRLGPELRRELHRLRCDRHELKRGEERVKSL